MPGLDGLAIFSVCVLVGGFGFGWIMGYRAAKEDGVAGRKYDATLARMAGNMAAGLIGELVQAWRHGYGCPHDGDMLKVGEPRPVDCRCPERLTAQQIAEVTVRVSREIVEEVIRTSPAE